MRNLFCSYVLKSSEGAGVRDHPEPWKEMIHRNTVTESVQTHPGKEAGQESSHLHRAVPQPSPAFRGPHAQPSLLRAALFWLSVSSVQLQMIDAGNSASKFNL